LSPLRRQISAIVSTQWCKESEHARAPYEWALVTVRVRHQPTRSRKSPRSPHQPRARSFFIQLRGSERGALPACARHILVCILDPRTRSRWAYRKDLDLFFGAARQASRAVVGDPPYRSPSLQKPYRGRRRMRRQSRPELPQPTLANAFFSSSRPAPDFVLTRPCGIVAGQESFLRNAEVLLSTIQAGLHRPDQIY